MGIVERVRAQRDGPQASWSVGSGALQLIDRTLGHDDETFSPARYGDYLVTSNEVFSAAMLRARAMAGLTIRLYDRDGPEKKEQLAGHEYELLRHVNPFWTRRRLAMMDELSMCLWGESFWAIERDRTGRPSEIWWMKPDRVRPVPDESNYLNGFRYNPVNGGPPIRFAANEVVWFRYPNPLDEFSPLSPIAAARLGADTASAMMKSNRNMFTNGMQLGGIVVPETGKVTFSPEQADDLEKSLSSRFKGADKAHKWAVLRYEAKFHQMQVTQKDAQWVEGLNLTLRHVANAFGIPVPLLNEMSSATLANAREYERLLWTHSLVPDAQLRAEEIVEQFLPMFPTRARWAEFDFSKIAALQESQTEQWSREAQAIERGALTINEWRRSKGMADVEWGDVWWAPVNKSAVTSSDSTPEGDTSPTTIDDDDAAALLDAFTFVRPISTANGHRHPERVST